MQQGTDLITQLAQIRERQGKEPLPNPGFIQGFGENDPPSPPPPIFVPGTTAIEEGNEDLREDLPTWNPKTPTGATHYVAKTVDGHGMVPDRLSEEMVIPQFKLVVMDAAAQYLGHATVLSEEDQNLIRQIVVKSVKRELDAAVAPEASGRASEAPPSPKRGRGRPRKHPVAE